MSTANLSAYREERLPSAEVVRGQRYAVVTAEWNGEITEKLKEGAVKILRERGACEVKEVYVPGSFELVYAAKELQETRKYAAVIVLGCVIRGETPHFDYVCEGVTEGISRLNARAERCPVIFGLLTTEDFEQAAARAGGNLGNKGVECGITAIRMANLDVC